MSTYAHNKSRGYSGMKLSTMVLLLLGVSGYQPALANPVVTAQNGLSCAGARYGSVLNCNAGEFAAIVNISHAAGSSTSCTEGEYFNLTGNISLENSNADRYNVGFFTGENGNDPRAVTGQCSVATFPNTPAPWFNADGNTCGDFVSRGTSNPVIQNLRVLCTGDSSGQLLVPYVVSYQQNAQSCSGPVDVMPGSPSKCNAGTATITSVIVKPKPAAYYKFDEASWSGVAGEIKDSSDSGLDGRAYNGATTAGASPAIGGNPGTCRYGTFSNGHLLTTNDDYVQIPHDSALQGTDALTYTAWINPLWSLFDAGTQVVMSKSAFVSGSGAAQMGIYADMGLLNVTLKGRAITSSGAVVEVEAPTDYAYNNWTHVALVFAGNSLTLYVDGAPVDTTTVSATTLRQNTNPLTIGNDYGRSYYFNGHIDEARVYKYALNTAQLAAVMDETHPCDAVPTGLHHIRVLHDGSAVSCSAETITVRACADADCTTFYADGVTGSVTAGGNTVGFIIPAGQHQVTTNMHLPSDTAQPDPQSVRFGTGATTPAPSASTLCQNTATGIVNDTTACDVSVYKAGFLFDVPHLSSAVASGAVDVFAVRASDQNSCVPLFQGVTRDVAFWGGYLDPLVPVAGTPLLLVDGSSVETTTTPAYTSTRSLYFDADGKATLTGVRYDDVGLMQLSARYVGNEANTTPDGGLIVLGSDSFVVKPHHFVLTDITCTDGTSNPVATSAGGAAFCRAGQEFSATVTAMNALGAVTRNFGQETNPEGVKLTANLVAGLGLANNPDLGNDTAFGAFSNGVATGTTFMWPEVGIMTLAPSIGDGDYLGAGDVSGTTSGNIGRFYPASFAVTHTHAPGCGGFTYAGLVGAPATKLGQPFSVSGGSVTARNVAGTTTANYSGAFAKLSDAGITAEPKEGGAAAAGQLTAWAITLAPFSGGVGSFSGTDTNRYAFNAEGGPQTVYLKVIATDSDGVTGYEEDNTKTVEYRFGRMRLTNTHGSELLGTINVPFTAEYYHSGGYYTLNTADGCTTLDLATALQLSTDGASWSSGTTTMTVGGGTTSAVLANAPLAGGDAGLSFNGPGAGNTGYLELRGQLTATHPWLMWDWDGDGIYDNDPSARLTFGIYEGSPKQIYLQERY